MIEHLQNNWLMQSWVKWHNGYVSRKYNILIVRDRRVITYCHYGENWKSISHLICLSLSVGLTAIRVEINIVAYSRPNPPSHNTRWIRRRQPRISSRHRLFWIFTIKLQCVLANLRIVGPSTHLGVLSDDFYRKDMIGKFFFLSICLSSCVQRLQIVAYYRSRYILVGKIMSFF